jgi:hypothetical protein
VHQKLSNRMNNNRICDKVTVLVHQVLSLQVLIDYDYDHKVGRENSRCICIRFLGGGWRYLSFLSDK